MCDLRTERVTPFIAPKAGGLKNPSGLGFGDAGYLYVAGRSSRQILRYCLEDGSPDRRPFIDNLQDEPQFIEPVTRCGLVERAQKGREFDERPAFYFTRGGFWLFCSPRSNHKSDMN
jgi:hypothetical protein